MSLAGRTYRSSVSVGDVVNGRYTVVREVGSGTFGTVFLARHVLLGHQVALKVLNQRFVVDEATRARFAREVRAAATIDHPGIVDVFDADITESGVPFVAMEWLEGDTLRARQRRQRLSLPELLAVTRMLLEALAAAHERHFVHRDLKPENIFLASKAGGRLELKILDFGLSRQEGDETVTESGISLGTPQYMSPEQIMSAKEASPTADVWAVGVMLYEALARRLPFSTDGSKHALMLEIMTKDHMPLVGLVPDLPPPILALIEKCLAKEPSERYPDAGALLKALHAAAPSMPAVVYHDEATLQDTKAHVMQLAGAEEPTPAVSSPLQDLPPSPYAATEPSEPRKGLPPIASLADPPIPTTRAMPGDQIRSALEAHASSPLHATHTPPTRPRPAVPLPSTTRPTPVAAEPKKRSTLPVIIVGTLILLVMILGAGAAGYLLYGYVAAARPRASEPRPASAPAPDPSLETHRAANEPDAPPAGDFLDRDQYPLSTPSALPPRAPVAPVDLDGIHRVVETETPAASPTP